MHRHHAENHYHARAQCQLIADQQQKIVNSNFYRCAIAVSSDLHTLVQRKFNWDDKIPNDLLNVWHNHFDTINEISNIHFKRAVIPDDAANLEVTTLDFADASKELVCVAIYARFLRKCGKYSCQLIFSRSKLVPDGMTIPRAELLAANMNER